MRTLGLGFLGLCLALTSGACGSSTTHTSDASDANASDAASDGLAPDSADAVDAPQDTGPAGVWRLTTVTLMGDGGSASVNDTDTTITVNGTTIHARVNGLLALTNSSLAIAVDFLASGAPPPDHLTVDQNAVAMGMPRLNANGIGTAGTLDTTMSRFVGVSSGGMASSIPLTNNPDGTMTIAPFGSSVTLTYTRPATPVSGAAMVTSNGVAISIPVGAGMSYLPFAHPRAVILWDHANAGTGYTPSNDTAITISGTPPRSDPYAMNFGGMPPADSIVTTGGVPVALGYVIIYDDVNANMQLDLTGGTDVIRGISTVAIGWRGDGTPDATFSTSRVANLLAGGYQTVTLIAFVPSSGVPYVAAMPNDPTNPVNLDAPIFNVSVMASRIPDIL